MQDPTEAIRRDMVEAINVYPGSREALEKEYGQVWDTAELSQDYEVTGFMAPFVCVVRKSDRVEGTLTFQHAPRYYFGFLKS